MDIERAKKGEQKVREASHNNTDWGRKLGSSARFRGGGNSSRQFTGKNSHSEGIHIGRKWKRNWDPIAHPTDRLKGLVGKEKRNPACQKSVREGVILSRAVDGGLATKRPKEKDRSAMLSQLWGSDGVQPASHTSGPKSLAKDGEKRPGPLCRGKVPRARGKRGKRKINSQQPGEKKKKKILAAACNPRKGRTAFPFSIKRRRESKNRN